MTVIPYPHAGAPATSDLDRLISRHGPWRVLHAVMLALVRRPPCARTALPASDHLRRDIGLPPQSAQASPALPCWPLR